MRSRIMICLRNWDSPWRGNGRTHLNCWLVKGHAITLSGIAKTVNMCKSPSSFLTQSLGGSGSQREGILPEELFTFAPVTLLICILLKREKEGGVHQVLPSAGRPSTSLSQGPLPLFLLHQPKNGVSATNPVAVLEFASIDEHTITLKGRKKVTVTVSNAGCSVHGSLKVFKISVL